jgi:hypothetical protein
MSCENCTCDNPETPKVVKQEIPEKEYIRYIRSEALHMAKEVAEKTAPIENDTKRAERMLAMAKTFEAYLRGD